MLAEFAERFTGSSDLYKDDNRRPTASINFITAHDGFTLYDLVSYNEKHNEANGENNEDGEAYNRSWNCGAEGPTDDPVIRTLRQQQLRNFIATLLLSQGVPMLPAGDELAKTQGGNNNAYCQDNEISWVDWRKADQDLLAFTRKVIALRKAHPVFSRRKWFEGVPIQGMDLSDISWHLPDGSQMQEMHWKTGFAKSLATWLNGKAIRLVGEKGERIVDDNFYVIFNGHYEELDFTIPDERFGRRWVKVLDTSATRCEEARYSPSCTIKVPGRSIILLHCPD
jgi:glycogen operon protein